MEEKAKEVIIKGEDLARAIITALRRWKALKIFSYR